MRVAFLTTEYPTEDQFAGGLASYLHRVATALVEGGHDAEVFTLSLRDERIWDGSTLVHRVKRKTRFQSILAKASSLGRGAGHPDVILPAWNLAAALHRRHRETPFDVIQASNYRACGIVAALRHRIPMVTRVSSYEPSMRAMYAKPLTRLQRFVEKAEILQMRWSSATYAPSHLIAETLKVKEALDVRVIEPPFSLEPPPPALPPLAERLTPGDYGLFFGFLGPLKGCDRLVNVLPALLHRNPELKFAFIGPTSPKARFDDYIRERLQPHTDQRVFVLGQQRHPTLLPLVQGARFVVLPSRIDNLPNTCLEAMALRRVVIGTYGASFEQLIENGVNGFLVSQDDDGELASCMERAWQMPTQERDRIGDRAAHTLQRMRPEHAIGALVSLFDEVRLQRRQQRHHGVSERLNTLARLQTLLR
jgi:glycosyltransferase involved in cell wall biosynthesis